jgi:hypothetical protein
MLHIGWDTLHVPRVALQKMRTLYARARGFNGDVADAIAILHETTVTQIYAIWHWHGLLPTEMWMRRRRVMPNGVDAIAHSIVPYWLS